MAFQFAIHRTCFFAVVVVNLLGTCIASAQVAAPPTDQPAQATDDNAVIKVIDEEGVEHTISPVEFARLPRRSATAKGHGPEAEFEGVALVDLLKLAGVKFGDALKGRRAATVAILEAADNYRIVVALLEIDPEASDRLALVAEKRDGKPLDAKLGPYRLVIPGDKREIRWIRNLRTIRVANLVDFPLRDGPQSKSSSTSP